MNERLTHGPSGTVLAQEVGYATSSATRARGLIGRTLVPGSALVLVPGNQVHTFFMPHAIDVVFCDRDWNVLHVVSPMQPWRVSKWVRSCRCVIELPPGTAAAVKVGDRLELSAVEGPV